MPAPRPPLPPSGPPFGTNFSLRKLTQPAPPDPEAEPVRYYFYTSGTTSDPKGVKHTDQTLIAAGVGHLVHRAIPVGIHLGHLHAQGLPDGRGGSDDKIGVRQMR